MTIAAQQTGKLYQIKMRLIDDSVADDNTATRLSFSLAAKNLLEAESKARDNAQVLGYPAFGWFIEYRVSDLAYMP